VLFGWNVTVLRPSVLRVGLSCIDAGPERGTCCDDDYICGPSCCNTDETCQNWGTGLCCLPDKQCGDVCCGRAGGLDISFCADPSESLCCMYGEEACGGTCGGGAKRHVNQHICFQLYMLHISADFLKYWFEVVFVLIEELLQREGEVK
jgi:hypothetical protein